MKAFNDETCEERLSQHCPCLQIIFQTSLHGGKSGIPTLPVVPHSPNLIALGISRVGQRWSLPRDGQLTKGEYEFWSSVLMRCD